MENGPHHSSVTASTVVDFSQRNRAEDALAAERTLLRTLFDALPDIVFTKDMSGRFSSCNAAMLAHCGLASFEDVAGRSVFDLYPADMAQGYHADDQRVFAGETVLNHEESSPDASGAKHWFLTTKVPLRDAAGNVYGLVGVSRDITERKSMEEDLRDSEDRFRRIAESLPQMVWTCQADGACDYLSRQWLEYTGIPAELQLGFGWLDQVHQEDRGAVIEAWKAAVAGDTDFKAEFRIRRHDGVHRLFDTRAVRLRDTQGRTAKWLGSNTDIEDRKHGEEIQRRSQKMEALGTLAGGIAHDFNNILLAITGNAKLGLEELPPEHPAHECLVEIDKASARAVDLVRRILAFSRQQDSRRDVMSLEPVVDEALKLLGAALPAMIEIKKRFAPGVPPVSADPTQIHQIVMNLATNSAHAIGESGGLIEVALDALDMRPDLVQTSAGLHAGRYARLSVTDNGCGMGQAVLERIFDPFFTTKPVGQGTGLGLSAVHGIMRSHDGAITVYSEPGKGTTFRLYFPAVEDALPEARPARYEADRVRGERVMYVDDEAPLVYLTTRLLQRVGYAVTGFTDAAQAVVAFRNRPQDFDVVVTDIAMPGMSGFALVRYVRGIRPDIPVIMTSGYVRPEDQDKARELGVRELIVKPDTVEELTAAIDRVFQDR